MKNIHEKIYEKLQLLIPDLLTLRSGNYRKSRSDGYMDLSFDVLSSDNEYIVIALAHNYILNGDVVPDPDMEIRISKNVKFAEALTYQDIWRYDCVYDDENNADQWMQNSLNSFLNTWLSNCIKQGHQLICAQAK